MMIATGHTLREQLLEAHGGETFIEYLIDFIQGAPNIPHGIEEMAWDAYFEGAGWPMLLPRVCFSVHRSLIAGRDSSDPFAGLKVSSDEPHKLDFRSHEIDVGKADRSAGDLPTCRHSQALDCAEDSATWLAKGGGAKCGGAKRKADAPCQPCAEGSASGEV